MIRSELKDVVNEISKKGSAKDNQVEISIPKEEFPNFIKSYKITKLNFPTEEEAKAAYDELNDSIGLINFNLAISTLAEWDDPPIYSFTENNDFFYIGDFDNGCCRSIGIRNFYLKVLEYTYYLYKYKKSHYEILWTKDLHLCNYRFLETLENTLKSIKEFIARIALYKEAFIKLNMKKDLELLEINNNRINRIYSLALFSYGLIKQRIAISGECLIDYE